MNDFIGIYENAISENLCSRLIESFDRANQSSVYVETHNDMKRSDTSFRLSDLDIDLNMDLNSDLNVMLEKYIQEYPSLKSSNFQSFQNKMQVTPIGGGYHPWHFECATIDVSSRLLFWLLYLNDVEEGGETEFLYQKCRYKPKARTLMIAPASFTHTHRGNPPLSNIKYVATGWYNFV